MACWKCRHCDYKTENGPIMPKGDMKCPKCKEVYALVRFDPAEEEDEEKTEELPYFILEVEGDIAKLSSDEIEDDSIFGNDLLRHKLQVSVLNCKMDGCNSNKFIWFYSLFKPPTDQMILVCKNCKEIYYVKLHDKIDILDKFKDWLEQKDNCKHLEEMKNDKNIFLVKE